MSPLPLHHDNIGPLLLCCMPFCLSHCQLVELKPGGQHISVTADNREEFIHLLADYRLNKQVGGRGRRETKTCWYSCHLCC